MEIIVGRKGDQPFSITDKSVSGKHLKLTPLPDGNVLVEDLGSTNGTFIDNVRILKTTVSRDTVIRMGTNYTFKVSNVLPEVSREPSQKKSKNANQPKEVKEYSISHLKDVWDEYEDTLAQIKENTQKLAKKRMVPIMLGSASGLVSAFVGPVAIITIPIAVVSFYYWFKLYKEKDTSHEDTKEAKKILIQKYVCPNPDCHRTLSLQDYYIISQHTNCPHCKCKWTTK